jgi:hypothetical protein
VRKREVSDGRKKRKASVGVRRVDGECGLSSHVFIIKSCLLDPRSLPRYLHLLHPDEVYFSNLFVVLEVEETRSYQKAGRRRHQPM